MSGPLSGVRVLELSSIGPLPHACMILADLGADVVRVERPPGRQLTLTDPDWPDPLLRGRRRLDADLKHPSDLEGVRQLAARADVFLEGLRPGVAERLGVGPAELMGANDRLIYGRVSGWGRTGPLSERAGHDINYIGLSGVLAAIGPDGHRPVAPLNLVGDYGGGSMPLLVGILAALYERSATGQGQLVDSSILEGTVTLAQALWSLLAAGNWDPERGRNILDGGAPFYDTYECADGGYVAVGALEPQFYDQLLRGLELDPDDLPDRTERDKWPLLRKQFADRFHTRTRDAWASLFADLDACVSPVLDFREAAGHAQSAGAFTYSDDILQSRPAPWSARTPHVGESARTSISAALLSWRTASVFPRPTRGIR